MTTATRLPTRLPGAVPRPAPGGDSQSGRGPTPVRRRFPALRGSWNGVKTAVLLAGLGGLLVLLGAQFG